MNLDFRSRHVIVTGGTGALGSATVGFLIESGATVSVPCLRPEELAHFPHKGSPSVRITEGVDLTDDAKVSSFFQNATASAPLWASIHIAGGFAMAPAESTSKADFVRMFETNALTCFLCCREAIKAIKARAKASWSGGGGGGGRIVNVAARPGLSPDQGAGMVAYTAGKAAVAALTRALAAEVAADGILVNAVAPSIMDTPANRKAMPAADFAAWPKVEEVARVMAFLASPDNAIARGSVVEVYGRS